MGCPLDVHGVPERDGGGDESEATGAVALLLEAPVPDFSEAAEEHGSRECVARLTFVEAGVDSAAQLDALQPREDELGSFDPAQLAQGDCKAVLARVTAQLAKHERGRDGALLDRRGETKDLVPVSADAFRLMVPPIIGASAWYFILPFGR